MMEVRRCAENLALERFELFEKREEKKILYFATNIDFQRVEQRVWARYLFQRKKTFVLFRLLLLLLCCCCCWVWTTTHYQLRMLLR